MKTPTLNLLPTPTAGHVWLQVALDMDASDFRREHVDALRGAGASVVAVCRWMPMVELELPLAQAQAMVDGFEPGTAPFAGLPVRSLAIDVDSLPRIPRRDPVLARVWAGLCAVDWARLAATVWGSMETVLVAWLKGLVLVAAVLLVPLWAWIRKSLAMLPRPSYAMPTLGFQAQAGSWNGMTGRGWGALLEGWIPPARRWASLALRRMVYLIELGVRIPEEGLQGAADEVWPQEVNHAFARISDARYFSGDFLRIARALVETVLVDAVAIFVLGARLVAAPVAWLLGTEAKGPFGDGRWLADDGDLLFWSLIAGAVVVLWAGFLIEMG